MATIKAPEQKTEEHLIRALKLGYKHANNDDVGTDETIDALCDALCNIIGNDAFCKWVKNGTPLK